MENKTVVGNIVTVKDGVVILKPSRSESNVNSLPLDQQPKTLRRIVNKLADKYSMEKNAFDFFILIADFEAAADLAKREDEKAFLSEVAYCYLKQRLINNKDDKELLKRKYGKMPELEKALNDISGGK